MEDFINDLRNAEPDSWLLAFAIFSLIVGSYSLAFYVRISRWPSVIGELSSAGIAGWAPDAVISDRNYGAEISYRYQVGGENYNGNRLSPFLIVASHNLRLLIRCQMKGIKERGNGGVRVFYNPRQPEMSYLIAPNTAGYMIISSIMFLPLAAYFFCAT